MADHEALEVLVGASPLPVGLLDLAAFVLTAVSESAAEILGAPADELVGRDVLSLTDEVDSTRTALEAVASGVIDAYEASRRFRRGDGTTVATTLWVRDLSRDGYVDTALFLWRADHERIPTDEGLGYRAGADFAVGTIDASLWIDRMSPEIERLLGSTSTSFHGAPLSTWVHPDDLVLLTDVITHAIADRASVGTRLRIRRADDSWGTVRLVVSAGDGMPEPRLGFLMSSADAPVGEAPSTSSGPEDEQVAQHEQGLARLAFEVQAMMFAASMARLPPGALTPELAQLTTRQWDIVTRLLRGERVPGIARAMFLSQSTVRNHLSLVYRKLGVHSQAELIARLREEGSNQLS